VCLTAGGMIRLHWTWQHNTAQLHCEVHAVRKDGMAVRHCNPAAASQSKCLSRFQLDHSGQAIITKHSDQSAT
jgi:hypothetical protein